MKKFLHSKFSKILKLLPNRATVLSILLPMFVPTLIVLITPLLIMNETRYHVYLGFGKHPSSLIFYLVLLLVSSLLILGNLKLHSECKKAKLYIGVRLLCSIGTISVTSLIAFVTIVNVAFQKTITITTSTMQSPYFIIVMFAYLYMLVFISFDKIDLK